MSAESIFSKPPGHDIHMVKLVFVDSQNSQKLGNTKMASSTKRGASAPVNVGKGEVSVMKTVNQKRRAGDCVVKLLHSLLWLRELMHNLVYKFDYINLLKSVVLFMSHYVHGIIY